MESKQCTEAKLTILQAELIVNRVLQGKSNQEISDEFGLHSRYISLIRHKRRQKAAWARVEGATTIESIGESRRSE